MPGEFILYVLKNSKALGDFAGNPEAGSVVFSLKEDEILTTKRTKTIDISLILRTSYIFIRFLVPFVVFVVKTP
jgi:hypothetical protein